MKARQYGTIALIMLAVIAFAYGVIQTYQNHWKYPPAFVVLNAPKPGTGNNESHYAKQIDRVSDDDPRRVWIVIGREFQITRDVRIRVSRELLLTHTSSEVAAKSPGFQETYKYQRRKELETSHVQYHPGFYKNERELQLPIVPPGTYSILNVVCWPVTPNHPREDCIDLPEVTVEVHDKVYP